MNHSPKRFLRNDYGGLAGRLLLVAIVMSVAGLLLISLGVFAFGTSIQVGLVAWIVCTITALLAHVGGEYPRGDFNFAARMAIQMVVRTAIPFAVAIWGVKFAQPPLETSLVFYILSFYMIGLIVDVQLHVARLKADQGRSGSLEIKS